MNKLSQKNKDLLYDAISEVMGETAAGVNPSEAVIKVAQEHGLGWPMTQLLIAAYNTGAATHQREIGKTAADKLAEYETARPEVVHTALFGKSASPIQWSDYLPADSATLSKVASETYVVNSETGQRIDESRLEEEPLQRVDETGRVLSHEEGARPSISINISWDRENSAAGALQEAKHDMHSLASEQSDAEWDISNTLGGMQRMFDMDGVPPCFQRNCRHMFGDSAGPALVLISRKIGLPDDIPSSKLAAVDRNQSPYAEVGQLIQLIDKRQKCAQAVQELQTKIAAMRTWEKDATKQAQERERQEVVASTSPFLRKESASAAPTQSSSWFGGGNKSKSPATGDKDPSKDKNKTDPIWGRLRDKAHKFLAKTVQRPVDLATGFTARIDNMAQNRRGELEAALSSTDVADQMQQIRAQTVLNDLMTTDPVVSEFPEDRILDAYNAIAALSPAAVLNRATLGAMLRSYLQSDTLDLPEIRQVLDLNASLTDREFDFGD